MNNQSQPSPIRRSVSRRGFLSGLGAAAIALPILSACGTTAGSGTAASVPVYSQPGVKVPGEYAGRTAVVLWSPWGGNNGAVLAQLIKTFNDSQKDIYAEIQQFDGYDGVSEKLTAGLQAKQVPELAVLSDVTWNRYFLNGTLEPLSAHHSSGFGPDAYHPRFYEEGLVRDESYWVPFARSTPLFYYNKEIFAAAGLPDRAPATWEEFRGWGKEVSGISYNGNAVKMRALHGGDDWYFSGLLWAFGGSISKGLDVKLDIAESIAAAEFDRATVLEDKIAYLAQSFVTDFTNGQVATITQSTGGLTALAKDAKFEFGTGFLPKGIKPGVPTGGGGLSIMRNADPARKAAAVELLKFLATEEASARWTAQTGYLPATTAALKSAKVAELMAKDANYKVAVDQLAIAQGPDHVRKYVNSGITEMKDVIQKLYVKNESAESVMKAASQNLRRGAESIRANYNEKVA